LRIYQHGIGGKAKIASIMSGNGMSLKDFMNRLAVDYPLDHARMRVIISLMHHDLLTEINLHRQRIAQFEADRRNLASLTNMLVADADVPADSDESPSPPARRRTGSARRHPETPVDGVLVPDTIDYSGVSNGCLVIDSGGFATLHPNTPTPDPASRRTALPSRSTRPDAAQNSTIAPARTPGNASAETNPETNEHRSPQSQISTQQGEKRPFHSPNGSGQEDDENSNEQGVERVQGVERQDDQELVISDVVGDSNNGGNSVAD
jgi:hypothetical protein